MTLKCHFMLVFFGIDFIRFFCIDFKAKAAAGKGESRSPDPQPPTERRIHSRKSDRPIFGRMKGIKGTGGKSTTTRPEPQALKTWRRPCFKNSHIKSK